MFTYFEVRDRAWGEECCCVVEGIPGCTTSLAICQHVDSDYDTGVLPVLLMELENVLLVFLCGR